LGDELRDPDGVEGALPTLRGMGLLPCTTTFAPEKTLTRVRATVTGGALRGAAIEGYEIHMGATEVRGEAFCRLADGTSDGCRAGNVWGTYLHGLFDSGEATDKLATYLCKRKGVDASAPPQEDRRAYRERQYDLLADGVRKALDMETIYRILEGQG